MHWLSLAVAAAACLLALAAPAAAAATTTGRPLNILMITSDSMDGRVLDARQHLGRSVALPHLRALAARGTSFINAYSPSPVCGPSRIAALTGRHVHQTGTWNNYQELPADATGALDASCVHFYGAAACAGWAAAYPVPSGVLFDAFAEANYEVRVIGKVDGGANIMARYADPRDNADHTGPEARTVPRGAGLVRASMAWGGWSSDTRDNNTFAGDVNITADAAQWLQTRAANASETRPFFLYTGLAVPHFPFVTGPQWLAQVNRSTIHPPWLPDLADLHPYDAHMVVSKGCNESQNTREAMLQLKAVYLAMCAQADAIHGALLDTLSALGLDNSTLVVFWSDHGEMAWDARQTIKDSFREGSARVPLIFAGPGVAQGRVIEAPASLLDLWPTLADAAGVRAPADPAGHSLAPALAPGAQPRARAADFVTGQFFAENSDTGCFFVRQGDFKYVRFGQSFPWFKHYAPLLFNITEDPLEQRNVLAAFPAQAAALDALLVSALGDVDAIDASVMRNDQRVFREYLTANMSAAEVRRLMVGTYQGFDDADWARVLLWNATEPGAWRQGGARAQA
jgi:arylsulfatase A-like enzyme